MWAPMDMNPAWPKDSCPTVMGRNMLRPMIMLIPMVARSASPSENSPVKTPTNASSTPLIAAPLPGARTPRTEPMSSDRTARVGDRARRGSSPARLDLQPAAEEARRLVEEDEDQDPEGEAVLPRGHEVGHAHRLDHPEDESGDHGAHDVAGSAEEHDREALEAEDAAHQRRDVVGEPDQDARRPGEGRRDAERPDRDPVHVHPEEARGLGVLRARPHGLAHLGLLDEEVEADHEDERRGDDEHLHE